MSQDSSHPKSFEPDQLFETPAELHRVSQVPVSPMRLAAMSKRPKQLLTLNLSSDWLLTHVEMHRILNTEEPLLVPQTWHDDIGVLVIAGTIRAETAARKRHQATVIRVGSLLRVSRIFAKLPTRTTLTCLSSQADFALLGNNPAQLC